MKEISDAVFAISEFKFDVLISLVALAALAVVGLGLWVVNTALNLMKVKKS